MKKVILLLLLITNLFSQYFGGNISLIGHLPQGEFKDQGVTAGYGLDINAMYNVVDELAFGLNVGFSVYDNSKRSIPFNYFSDLVHITEETTNSIGYGHLFLKIVPFQTKVRPYFEGLLGFKNLNTKTELYNEDCYDNPDTQHDDCEIASSTNASDNALSYGLGGGLEIFITSFNNEEEDVGKVSFFIGLKYLWGGEAEYLKEGSITFSDPEDGPVETYFDWNKSNTDLMQINLGLHIELK